MMSLDSKAYRRNYPRQGWMQVLKGWLPTFSPLRSAGRIVHLFLGADWWVGLSLPLTFVPSMRSVGLHCSPESSSFKP